LMKAAEFEKQNGNGSYCSKQRIPDSGRQRRSKGPTAYGVVYVPFAYPIIPIIRLLSKDHPFPTQLRYSGTTPWRA
jgi:hypothetical protein